ncbi:MAG: T9SS type A sorting domain-containing protein [Candidatus Cloacimonadaceae bacterium]|nr:T9SS type A sorting domain-containing protein [Candidatus Cloacimonadaceae bacterium]
MKATLLVLLLIVVGSLSANKMILQKHGQTPAPKIHHYTPLLRQFRNDLPDRSKQTGFNKLLVILIDFQEELTDNANTTGNGKFQLEPAPSYLYSIGSPPHDRQYFEANLEALRYYYLAASNGYFDLEYDVFPQDRPAYTLPQPMGYYNPPGASSALFVSRMEEYFKASFELADDITPQIEFGAYSHYMIIHAGSDWQHDVFGDTPSDLPSFYIRVGDGKEAVVDNGTTLISHACNVPATISQDFRTNQSGDVTIHSGYGALNAVIAHEFGHSVGLVDLYNVYNFQPMVGVFDIMDSGGSGVLVDELSDGSLIMIEGALPTLPGAFSKVLMFGNHFSETGYLKDIDQVSLFLPLQLSAGSLKQSSGNIKPQILKLPLSADEYVLIENRNVDPDGDGGTAVFGTLDSRVILYPTPMGDPNNNPSYEYDYLLPSFQKADGSAIGGGILVWHINNDVILNQGVVLSDGSWVSNFDNNSVNRSYNNRGVKIIEADALPDIGNEWSWYWTGTQYEYFHKFKPVLDSNGLFVNWSLQPWKSELSSETDPPLIDSKGVGSLYRLSEISNPAATMSLKLKSGFFENHQLIATGNGPTIPAPVINSSFSSAELPLISFDGITLLSFDGNTWADQFGAFPFSRQPYDYPITVSNQSQNSFKELIAVSDNCLKFIEFWDDALSLSPITFPDNIICAPLTFADAVFSSTPQTLFKIQNNAIVDYIPLPGIKRMSMYHDHALAVLTLNKLVLIDPLNMQLMRELSLSEAFGDYEPVAFSEISGSTRYLFIMSNAGNIYRFNEVDLIRIFSNPGTVTPTQMGITKFGVQSPVIFFGIGKRAHAIKSDGSFLSAFPYIYPNGTFTGMAHVYALGDFIYLPILSKGYLALTPEAKISWSRSLIPHNVKKQDYFFWEPVSGRLNWYYSDLEANVHIHQVSMPQNPIRWNGFRNAESGVFKGDLHEETASATSFNAYVYPNPVRGSDYRLRLENATGPIKISIFDVSGLRIESHDIDANATVLRDIQLSSLRLASGVYILNVRSGNKSKRIKFAIEK